MKNLINYFDMSRIVCSDKGSIHAREKSWPEGKSLFFDKQKETMLLDNNGNITDWNVRVEELNSSEWEIL